ncbi:unnamed protein product, partial [Adineta steineri]
MQCLPADQVSGEAVDCFRASFDDFKYLIVANITFQMYKFRCWIDTECIEDENLCNANEDCPMYDNELLCLNRSQLCYHSDFDKLLNMQDISYQVINKPYLSFSLDTALDYPSSYTTQNKSVENQIHDKMITSSLVKSSIQSEICNFGLYVYHRLGIDKYSSICFCPPNYYGDRCQYQNQRVSLTLTLATVRQPTTYIIVVMLIEDDNDRQEIHSYHQFTYIPLEHCAQFRVVIVKIDNRYYLAVLRKFVSSNIVTSISPAQRCVPIHELVNDKLFVMPRIQRLKSYHIPCQRNSNLQCFVDEFYMCLCTEERHSNCFPLEHQQTFACEDNVYCENGGTCLQDRRICFLNILCVCNDCFFGDRCQFYAKGIGLTLDDLLRYEIRPNSTLNDQSLVVKLSAVSVMILFLI